MAQKTDTVPKDQRPVITGNKHFILSPGKTFRLKEDIINKVFQQISGQPVQTVDKCDAILVFCVIVSRAGTDIDAALNELNSQPVLTGTKPVVFMVLHHTFDPEKIVPDSSRYVSKENTLTVDCLFYEEEGLLNCAKNSEALTRIRQWLQPQETQDKEIFLLDKSNLIIASELKLVLLGTSVREKTAVEHMILNTHESVCECSPAPLMKMTVDRGESVCECSPAPLMKMTVDTGEVEGGQLIVINTPDSWFSSELSTEEIEQKIQFCIRLFSPGPYTSLLVIPVKQFHQTEKERLEKLNKTFRKKHIILFTATNEQEEQEIQKHDLKSFEPFCVLNISQIGNRSQVSKLLEKVKNIVEGNESSDVLYTDLNTSQIEEAIAESEQVSVEEVKYIKVSLQKGTFWINTGPIDPNDCFVMVEAP